VSEREVPARDIHVREGYEPVFKINQSDPTSRMAIHAALLPTLALGIVLRVA
jgi:hypothetical protein